MKNPNISTFKSVPCHSSLRNLVLLSNKCVLPFSWRLLIEDKKRGAVKECRVFEDIPIISQVLRETGQSKQGRRLMCQSQFEIYQ